MGVDTRYTLVGGCVGVGVCVCVCVCCVVCVRVEDLSPFFYRPDFKQTQF